MTPALRCGVLGALGEERGNNPVRRAWMVKGLQEGRLGSTGHKEQGRMRLQREGVQVRGFVGMASGAASLAPGYQEATEGEDLEEGDTVKYHTVGL